MSWSSRSLICRVDFLPPGAPEPAALSKLPVVGPFSTRVSGLAFVQGPPPPIVILGGLLYGQRFQHDTTVSENSIAYDLIAILSPMPVKSCILRKSESQRVTSKKQLYPDLKQRLKTFRRKNLFLIKLHFISKFILAVLSSGSS